MANCNLCPNQCPEEALKCGRGRAYFGQENTTEEKRHYDRRDDNEVVSLLRKCGHMLHHGEVSGRELEQKLSEEEQQQLIGLLNKLL